MGDIVLKIGGSSLASAEGFRQAVDVIRRDPRRRYVVVSAPGKRTERDVKVTDLLRSLRHTEHPIDTMQAIKGRFMENAVDLKLSDAFIETLDAAFTAAEVRFKKMSHGSRFDFIESRGEYLNALTLAAVLGPEWRCIDAATLIRFDENGRYDPKATKRAFRRCALEGNVVIPGYYGADSRGRIRTFSRGGSDITGAIVAAMVDADLYENATDVPGVYVASPNMLYMVPALVERMTYSLMQEMAYYGANVLHYETIYHLREARIPTRIFGLKTPNISGTYIYPDDDKRALSSHVVIGIVERPDFTMFTIKKPGMNADDRFTLKALSALAEHELGYDHITTGLDTLDIIIPGVRLAGKREPVAEAIRNACAAEVTLTSEIGIVCLVGQDLGRCFIQITHILNALAAKGIEPIFYELGGSRTNLVIGVAQVRLRDTVRTIYEYMFRNHL